MPRSEDTPLIKEEISERIEDLASRDGKGTAISLALVALEILARQYPPKLDDKDRLCIRDNYPSTTDQLTDERAMSEKGVLTAIASATGMARIAIDYSPLSHTKSTMDLDTQLPQENLMSVRQALNTAFDRAEAEGLSPFGVATTMILLAVVKAQRKGVTGLKLVRPLLDAISLALTEKPSPKAAEEYAITAVCEQMGISRAAAKKYVAMAKMIQPDD